MSNPSCLQTGAACRYADADGRIYDALITMVLSTTERIVSIQYGDGRERVENVLSYTAHSPPASAGAVPMRARPAAGARWISSEGR